MFKKLVGISFALLLMGCGESKNPINRPIDETKDISNMVTVVEPNGFWRVAITATPIPGGILYVASNAKGLSMVFVPTPK